MIRLLTLFYKFLLLTRLSCLQANTPYYNIYVSIMLVFAAIAPPSPLLLPVIGKEHTQKLALTVHALDMLSTEYNVMQCDTIVVISQYSALPERLGVGIAETYTGSLKSFGNLSEFQIAGSPSFGQRLLAHSPHGVASAVGNASLDHGTQVALRMICTDRSLPMVPLYPCNNVSFESHVRFGASIAEPIINAHERIGLLAVNDLSHHLSEFSPEGYRPEGVLFDKAVINALKKQSPKSLLETAHKYEEEVSINGLRAFLIFMGILENIHTRFHLLSYESPFGIGYLTAEYIL